MPEQAANELYTRQQALNLRIPNAATVVGCGGTGFWVGIYLAMSGVEDITLIDDDTLEVSNLNRLPVSRDRIGGHKVTALKQEINHYRPTCSVTTVIKKLTEEMDYINLKGTVFCCTDNVESQRALYSYCTANNMLYQRCGYDGINLNVSRSCPIVWRETNTQGYDVDPSWVVPASASAALAVFSQLHSEITICNEMNGIGDVTVSMIPDKVRTAFVRGLLNDEYGFCPDCDRNDCDSCDYYSPSHHEELMSHALYEQRQEHIEATSELRVKISLLEDKLKKYEEEEANELEEVLNNA